MNKTYKSVIHRANLPYGARVKIKITRLISRITKNEKH